MKGTTNWMDLEEAERSGNINGISRIQGDDGNDAKCNIRAIAVNVIPNKEARDNSRKRKSTDNNNCKIIVLNKEIKVHRSPPTLTKRGCQEQQSECAMQGM